MLSKGDMDAFYSLWSLCIEQPRIQGVVRVVRGHVRLKEQAPGWALPVQQAEALDEEAECSLPLYGQALLCVRAVHAFMATCKDAKVARDQMWT
eukprot:7566295-Alexandrium_andersonii.AAC.1